MVLPGADHVYLHGAAHGNNGKLAICGSATDPAGHAAGFFAVVGREGTLEIIVRTEPYVPTAVSISPDGTIWTEGAEYVPVKRTPSTTARGIVRHFDCTGTLIGEYLPQSDFGRDELFLGISQLTSNGNRAGWYQGRHAAGYFEIARGGIERYPVIKPDEAEGSTDVSGLTITDDNRVFITRSVNGADPELYSLDRKSRRWNVVPVPEGGSPPATAWLIGGSSNLIVLKTTARSNWLRRFEVGRE